MMKELEDMLGKEMWKHVVYCVTKKNYPKSKKAWAKQTNDMQEISELFFEHFGAKNVDILFLGLKNGEGWDKQLSEFFDKEFEDPKPRFIPDAIQTPLVKDEVTSLSLSLSLSLF